MWVKGLGGEMTVWGFIKCVRVAEGPRAWSCGGCGGGGIAVRHVCRWCDGSNGNRSGDVLR